MAKPALQRALELASHLSLKSLYRLGDLLALFVRYTSNQVSRQARANIELCFADLDQNFRRQLYRDSLRHTCYSMTELAAVWCWPVEKLLAQISTTDICNIFCLFTNLRYFSIDIIEFINNAFPVCTNYLGCF